MTLPSSSDEAVTRLFLSLHIPMFPSFSLDETTTIATQWEIYKKRFENLLIALNVTNDSQELALLLNYLGEECYDICDNLLIPGTQESYNNTIQLFDGHFKPKPNISYEMYTSRKIKQNADETISKFFIRVIQQAVKRDFRENLNNEIKQQTILTTTSDQLHRQCFRYPDITLEEFLINGKTLEDAESKAAEVDQDLPEEPANVSKLQKRRIYRGNKSF